MLGNLFSISEKLDEIIFPFFFFFFFFFVAGNRKTTKIMFGLLRASSGFFGVWGKSVSGKVDYLRVKGLFFVVLIIPKAIDGRCCCGCWWLIFLDQADVRPRH